MSSLAQTLFLRELDRLRSENLQRKAEQQERNRILGEGTKEMMAGFEKQRGERIQKARELGGLAAMQGAPAPLMEREYEQEAVQMGFGEETAKRKAENMKAMADLAEKQREWGRKQEEARLQREHEKALKESELKSRKDVAGMYRGGRGEKSIKSPFEGFSKILIDAQTKGAGIRGAFRTEEERNNFINGKIMESEQYDRLFKLGVMTQEEAAEKIRNLTGAIEKVESPQTEVPQPTGPSIGKSAWRSKWKSRQ